ncbi:hypothetical protein IT397_03560 [Candidatus Nomurabacteria bacterium]|nr:hypothetical protein [Candidatus Nomurabacteria bacterium]
MLYLTPQKTKFYSKGFATIIIVSLIIIPILSPLEAKAQVTSNAAIQTVSGAASCSAGAVLGQLATYAIGTTIAKQAPDLFKVPVKTGADLNEVGITAGPNGEIPVFPALNAIAYCIVNVLIQDISASMIEWINNGFENPDGSSGPGFIKDPAQFFLDTGDREAGSFIENLGVNTAGGMISGGLLCSPFSVQIKLALLNNLTSNLRKRLQCTLTDVIKNADGFINGNFSAGGWAGWVSLTQNPQNNPYGAYLIANDEMYSRIEQTQNNLTMELGWGRGFLPFQKCEEVQGPTQNGQTLNGGKKVCTTTTPGAMVEESINRALGAGQNRLVMASSINNIVSALVDQLLKQVMGGMSNMGRTR